MCFSIGYGMDLRANSRKYTWFPNNTLDDLAPDGIWLNGSLPLQLIGGATQVNNHRRYIYRYIHIHIYRYINRPTDKLYKIKFAMLLYAYTEVEEQLLQLFGKIKW